MFNAKIRSQRSVTLRKPLSDLMKMKAPHEIMDLPKNKTLIANIESTCAWDEKNYNAYYAAVLWRFIEYVDLLPDSTNRFYGISGGLFDYALRRADAALSLFSDYLLVDEKNELSDIQRCWQYALFTASLLQGLGKLYLDYDVELYDEKGCFVTTWAPLLSQLMSQSPYYAVQVTHHPEDALFRTRLNLLLARAIMPEAGFQWIAGEREVFEAWLALLSEDTHGVKVLGAIMSRADALALMKAMEEWLERQGKYKARTFRTFDKPTDDAKDLSDQLGILFLKWLQDQIAQGDLILNAKEGQLNLAKSGLSMDPELFKLFVQEFPTYKSWQAVQKGFLSLGFNDASVNTAEILFTRFGILLPGKAYFFNANKGSKTAVSAVELMHFSNQGGQLVGGKSTDEVMTLPKLNEKGGWQMVEAQKSSLARGHIFRG